MLGLARIRSDQEGKQLCSGNCQSSLDRPLFTRKGRGGGSKLASRPAPHALPRPHLGLPRVMGL